MADHPIPAPARELSKKERDALIKRASDLSQEIRHHKVLMTEAYWDLAERLWQFHEIRGWEWLGYEKLSHFLAEPELGMSERSFYFAVRAWRDLVEVKKLPPAELKPIEPSKIREALPRVMAGQVPLAQAVADCSPEGGLSYRDVVEKYRQKHIDQHGQSPDGSTPLDASTEPKRIRCPTCDQWTTEDMIADASD